MKFKKTILITFILLAIMAIGSASAADDNVTADELTEIEDLEVETSISEQNDEILTVDESPFSSLAASIGSSSNTTLELGTDYKNDGTESHITISKEITIDGKGHTIDADGKSRIFNIESDNITLKNIVFKNGKVSGYDYGGVIYANNYPCRLENCTFINCSSQQYGGAVYINLNNDKPIEISNCTFMNCHGKEGSAVYLHTYNHTSVTNCTFQNCSCGDKGALYISDKNVDVINCRFMNCSSGNDGGGVYISGDETGLLNITGCAFTECSANNGGGLWLDRNNIISNCTFTKCSATNFGGGFYLCRGPHEVNNSTFTDCSASTGDAIYFSTNFCLNNSSFNNCAWVSTSSGIISNVFIDGVEYVPPEFNFKNDTQTDLTRSYEILYSPVSVNVNNPVIDGRGYTISGKGNSIFYITGENVTFKNVIFYDGEIYSSSVGTTLINCTFINSTATFYGEKGRAYNSRFLNSSKNAISLSNNNIISNCTFTKISTNSEGVLNIFLDNNNIVDCTFQDCLGEFISGAIYIQNIGGNNIDNCTFVNCSSTSTSGGAITINSYFFNNIIVNCRFIECSSNEGGGAIYWANSQGSINNTSFERCNATNGGAVYIQYDNLKIDNCSFVECSADEGGAIDIEGENIEIKGCRFTECSSDQGGAVYWQGTQGTMADSTFNTCNATNGGALYWGGSDGIVNNTSFEDCNATNGGGIYWNGDNGLITKNTFKYCSANSGGCVYADPTYDPAISDCKITCAYASEEAAAISGGSVSNCPITVEPRPVPGKPKTETTTMISMKTVVYLNENATFTVMVYDDNFQMLDGTVNIYVNSALIGTKNINEEFTYAPTKLGKNTIEAVFNENSTHNGSSEAANFNVIPPVVPETITSDDSGVVILEFPDDAKGTVQVFIDGISVDVVNIVNGIARIDLSKYKGGNKVLFVYSGDDKYAKFTKEANVNVKISNPVIVARDTKVLYDSGKFTVTVYRNAGTAAAGESVVVKINGKAFKTLKTDSRGVAEFKVTQAPGTYKVKIDSLGKTLTRTLTVKHLLSLKVSKKSGKYTLTATLAKANGKYVKGKITFKINGKKVKVKATSKKGVAKFTFKKSLLKKLKAAKKFKCQAIYKSDTATKTAKR